MATDPFGKHQEAAVAAKTTHPRQAAAATKADDDNASGNKTNIAADEPQGGGEAGAAFARAHVVEGDHSGARLSATTSTEGVAGPTVSATSVKTQNAATAGALDSGPGESTVSPADSQVRMPAGTLLAADAGPLVPSDVNLQRTPVAGDPKTSTNAVTEGTGVRSEPGEHFVKLIDSTGTQITDAATIFTAPAGPQTYVTVNKRISMVFRYRNSKQDVQRLLWPLGHKVDALAAARFKAAFAGNDVVVLDTFFAGTGN